MTFVDKFWEKVINPGKSFEEHMTNFMATVGMISLTIALIFDVIGGENIVEIIMLVFLIVALPVSSKISNVTGKIQLGVRMQVIFLVFCILPVTFFFGGGIRGGGVMWIALDYLYIALALSGIFRYVMFFSVTVMTVAGCYLDYNHPELIYHHTGAMLYLDQAVAIVLVGAVIYLVIRFQKKVLMLEAKRAEEKTKEAEELNRTQSKFFSSMSHEIRTPINSILGLNEIILRQDDASDEIIKDAVSIQGAGKMLLALVNDILDISKIEAGKMDIVPVNYKVSDLISEIVNMIWLRAEQKGLKFNVRIDPMIPAELFGDEVRIKQILINLLNNAIKYTKEGSVSLYMECEEKTEDGVRLNISVADTGMGIKQEALPYLFDAFQRADEEKNRNIEGTGLGLSIVKQLVTLMGGEITVNSVYTQGSTFTVSLRQGITDATSVGDIKISSIGSVQDRNAYTVGFTAPDARVLIVDDNEMNLEVEKKLLADTEMEIDTAESGREALSRTLAKAYDVILMDHLMPEMDGIECLAQIRKQTGGLNKRVPVIVLTANAGGENKKLYDTSGFDGYLVKPVSGVQLENMLLNHLPNEKVHRTGSDELSKDEMNTAKGYSRKIPVQITTSTMCDLPKELIKELGIGVIPFMIHADNLTFWDNEEADATELVKYIKEDKKRLDSEPPKVEEFEKFFAKKLRKAHHIIHIAITTSMSGEYERAKEAAKAFENVTVINSENLSSSTGLLVMIAARLAQKNVPLDGIIEELESAKKLIHCSFIIADNYYLMRRGFMSNRLYMFMKNLAFRPSLKISNDKFGVDHLWIGEKSRCYDKYIEHVLPRKAKVDEDVAFITYVDMSEEELLTIEDKIKQRASFKHIVFQKASAAISLNCGPGTFGILYMDQGVNTYHLSSMISEANIDSELDDDTDRNIIDESFIENTTGTSEAEAIEKTQEAPNEVPEEAEPVPEEKEHKWYEDIPGIDGEIAIKNSGSEDAFKTVLGIFYESIPSKSKEIEDYYEAGDIANYTIKVHALKSSARLIGAVELGKAAEGLEMAGKADDLEYIKENHRKTMDDYTGYLSLLSEYFKTEEDSSDASSDKPLADDFLIESVYEAIRDAADSMDIGMIEDTFAEIDAYSVPEKDADRFKRIREKADLFDYDGILSILDE